MAENTTTNHTACFDITKSCGSINPALVKTIKVRKHNIAMFTTATTLIFGGYFPGNFPPMEAAPQGIPMARQNWKTTTMAIKMAYVNADTV